jgi:predicted HicB family RNase H-like nuclease
MSEKVYGFTKSGKPIDDEMIEQFVEEAEQGYDVGQLMERRRGRGRPPLGDAVKVVGSLRLDPALRKEAEVRASAEGVSVSELVRRALREYLHVS